MKKIIYFGLLLLTVLLIPSCEDEEVELPRENGNVVFSFKSKQLSVISDKAGSLKNSLAQKGVEDAVAILISIENAAGASLHQQHRIDLINMNGHYLTSPLSLIPGNYSITEFIVIDESSNAIYITPQESSAYADFVSIPLPVSFTVTTNLVENVNLEVVGTENATPEDFGYASFSFTVVGDGTFGVSASVYNSAIPGMELTGATMVLSADGTELLTETLGAETNFFPIPGSYTTYTIEISKEDYTTVTKDFTRTELNALANNPYNAVLLNPDGVGSFTFVTDQTEGLNAVKLHMHGNTSSEFVIDWGDGSTDVYKADGSLLEHGYTEQIEYTVTVTGNIFDVSHLRLENSSVSEINLSDLLSLSILALNGNKLTNIDVTSNIQLYGLYIDSNQLTNIDLTTNLQLGFLDIESNHLTNIDLTSNTQLSYIKIRSNQLTNIDLSSNPLITTLSLSDNELTSIDLSSNPKLRVAIMRNNQLSSLDVSNNLILSLLDISSNQINDVADMELIYNQLLVNVRANNSVDGTITSEGNVASSQVIIDIANELTNDYNWSVFY